LLAARVDDEESIAFDRHIGGDAGRGDRAVAEVALRARDRHTQANLGWIRAAGRGSRDVPSEKFRLNAGENVMRFDLNAVVLTLAMLLPMTSRRRAFDERPESR
jgi:hypothetical protein